MPSADGERSARSAAGSQLIAAGAVVTPSEVLRPGWVEVSDDHVVASGPGEPIRPADAAYPDGTLVAGFVDIHVHGGGGASFTTGDADEAARAVAFHRRHGTTTMLASLVSAQSKELLRQVAALVDLVQDGVLAGIHLEGPWLAPGRRGAHDPQALRDPDPDEISRLLDAGRGAIRMVTLAPELPGGLDAVRQLGEAGVTVAVGHTEADYALTRAAIEAGAGVATHLFNGMPPLHHREPGPLLALMEDPRVVLELIADGTHLHPALVAQVMCTAGLDRVALVTDAMSAAGISDGSYTLGALDVEVLKGSARLPDGTIAGSTATTIQLFAAACTALRDTPDPLVGASKVTAATPAAALGLNTVGVLSPGHRADLVVVDIDGSLTGVMVAGTWCGHV